MALVVVMTILVPRSQDRANAQDIEEAFCYAVADEVPLPGGGKTSADTLIRINRTTGGDLTTIGELKDAAGNPTTDVETLAFGPPDPNATGALRTVPRLYTYDDDKLGIIDATTGVFTPFEIQYIAGKQFDIEGEMVPADRQGIDSLAFNPNPGDDLPPYLVAVVRIEDEKPPVVSVPDQVFLLDPYTGDILRDDDGNIIPGAEPKAVALPDISSGFFSQKAASEAYPDGKQPYGDVDDVAADPNTGEVFAILNNDGTGGGLAKLDPFSGAVTPIGLFTSSQDADQIIDDVEGLAYSGTGVLYGSTGANGPDAENNNRLYQIDYTVPTPGVTGVATITFVGELPANTQDYEGLACLIDQATNTIQKTTNEWTADEGPGFGLEVGGEIRWNYVVTNTGTVDQINLQLTDDKLGTIIDVATGENQCKAPLGELIPNNIFKAGASFECLVTGIVPGTDVSLGDTNPDQYENLGTVDSKWTGPDGKIYDVPDVSDPSFYFRSASPKLEIVKTAIAGASQTCPAFEGGVLGEGNPVMVGVGDIVTYCLTVRNSGTANAENVKIVDDKGTPGDTTDDEEFEIGTLAPGAEETRSYEATSTVPNQVKNIAVASATDLEDVSDPAIVLYEGTPGLEIDKKVVLGPDGDCAAAVDDLTIDKGQTVTYCIVATNSGELALSDVVINDDNATPSDLTDDTQFVIGDLAPGASTETQKYDRTISELVKLDNTATVVGQDPSGNSLTDTDPASVQTRGEPGLTIDKKVVLGPQGDCSTAVDRLLVDNGQVVTFCINVTNNGDATATNVGITDNAGTPSDTSDDQSTTIASLAPGESELWSYDREVVEAIVNTACIDGGTEADCDDATLDIRPILTIIKSVVVGADSSCDDAEQQVTAQPGETVKYCVTVQNVGKGDAIDVVVTDDNATISDTTDDQSFSIGTLKPGQAVTVPAYTRVITGAGPQLITNVATATGKDIDGEEVTPVKDDAEVDVPSNVSLVLEKFVAIGPDGVCDDKNKQLTADVGSTVTYCVTITNEGTGSAFDVKIFDDMTTPDDPSDDRTIEIGELTAGASQTVTYDLVVPPLTGGAEGIINTATATGVDKDGKEIPVNEDKTVVTPPPPGDPRFAVTKTILLGLDRDCADATEGLNELVIGQIGTEVTWCITIISDAEQPLGQFELTDEVAGISPDNQPEAITNLVLAPRESFTIPVNDTIDEEGVLNTVIVTAVPVDENNEALIDPVTGAPFNRISAENTAANGEAEIMLAKTVLYGAERDCAEAVNGTNDLATGKVGDAITWCFTATNVGGENLRVTEIVDPTLGLTLPVAEEDQLLAPAASVTLSAPGEITADMVENVASVEGTIVDTSGEPLVNPETSEPYGPVTDEDPAAEGPASLKIDKTVLAGADRDCSAATEGVDEFVVGETGDPITWCITITNDGTVSISELTFGDELLNITAGPLSDYLTSAKNLVLAPGESVTFPVAGTQQPAIAAGGETNTAIVTGVPVHDDGTPIPDAPVITDQDDAANDQLDIDLLKWMVRGHDIDCSTLPTDDVAVTGAPGDPISYCFRVTNTGNVDLTVTEIVDTTLDITLDIPTADQVLAPGESYNTSHESTITTGMTENTACVEGTATDPSGNTSTTSDCDVAPPPAAQLTDLAILKSAAQTSAKLGQVVDYTLTITNNGPGEAKVVRVEDVLPSQLVVVNGSVIGEGWDCSASIAKVDCTRPSMLPNTTSSIRFSAVLNSNPISGNTVTNTSTVSTRTTESDYTNNKDSHTVTIDTPIPPKPTPIPPKPTPIPPKPPIKPPPPVKPPPPKLALTGADSGQLATVGFAAIAAGLGLAVMTRRRREES